MNVTAIYTTQLKAALGIASESLEVAEGATVDTLVTALSQLHGDNFTRLVLDETNHLLRSIIVCVGDEQVAPGGDTLLADGDTVTFLSAISGG